MAKVGYVLLLVVTACGGRAGSGADGEEGAGSAGAPAACVAEGMVEAPESPVSGTVVGAHLRAAICSGGATAFVEIAQGSATLPRQTILIFGVATSDDPLTRFNFQLPTQAVKGAMDGLFGLTGPTPGVYSSDGGCGSVALMVTLPIPADLVCIGSTSCPLGCAFQGPVSGPTCAPVTPTVVYSAAAANSCASYEQIPRGSWSLTLTSVDPYDMDPDAANPRFVAHGALNAELWNSDGSDDSAQLSVAF